MRRKKILKRKIKRFLLKFLLLFFIIILFFSIYKIICWFVDSNKTRNQINYIQKAANLTEVLDNENTEIIVQEKEVPKANPYWDYIKMNMIDIDFKTLYDINQDIKGWIQVNGTNVNYPFVQTADNNYYLTHSLDKSYNNAGWVFMDYRNNEGATKNTILYAHARTDKTMFGSLKNILTNGWLNNTNNYVVKMSTESENTLWQVFSVYKIPVTNDYIQTNFSDDEEFLNLVNKLLQRSEFNFSTSVGASDRILTLSTCYNNVNRIVLHAKLIKKETKHI